MQPTKGVYGPDDVSWEVQEARDNASDEFYRQHKEEIDARDRMTLKRDLLARHIQDGIIYQDGDNQLWLGYEKDGETFTYAILNIQAAFVHFTPLTKATKHMARWARLVNADLSAYRFIAPKGCV